MSKLSKAEVQEIERRLAALPDPDMTDPDNPEWTEEDFAKARDAEPLPPEVIAAFGKKRGRPRLEAPKVQVSLRLDPDVLDYFRSTGEGWQARVNDALRRVMKAAF
jgi:uncharacterized protein (DUF4415 family)